jgi:peptidoglycan/LPS O-acetylase OafA/YrhL
MRWMFAVVLAVLMAWPWVARAADKDPLDYPIRQYGFMLGVALLGGLVSWWAKVRKGEARAWHLTGLVGELCTSAFAGLLAFWLCEWAATPPLLTASLVGISGHMGTRAITAFEEFAQKRYGGKV